MAAAMLMLTAVRTSAGTPDVTAGCDASTPRTLTIQIINAAGLTPEVIAAAKKETAAIFGPAGVRLAWTPTPGTGATRRVYVMLASGPMAAAGAQSVKRPQSHDTLGWVEFDADDRPGNVIRLWSDSIASLVRGGTLLNLPVGTLPAHLQEPLMGRAVGRVLAHEIGHWLAGRAHTKDGLMSARFRERDLIDYWSPPLPREWSALGGPHLAELSACSATM
jgi:hypothetical protein